MPNLNVFTQDAFSVLSLTDSINKIPFVPGRASQLIDWQPRGVSTTVVMVEERGGVLTMINPTGRGGPGTTVDKRKSVARPLSVPHYQIDDFINADEVQNIRAFGSESDVMSVQQLVNERLEDHALAMDPTLEYQRVGALTGIILNADGSTLYNLFTEFGVTQETEVDFDLDNASPTAGALRKACAAAVRKVTDNLGGVPFAGIHAFCGDAFFDDLLAHVEVRNSYLNTDMAKVLRDGYVYPNGDKIYGAFEFGGIVWENYRGKNGASAMVNTDKCHIFPVGVPGLYRTVYAPADWVDTVNTLGLARYSRQYLSHNGKGVHLESQANALAYCTRPKSLLKGKRT